VSAATTQPGPGISALVDGLTESQRHAVVTEGPTVCVVAGAGAGKTRVLTRRIAYRVTTGSAEARHVLALTFTRKAAGELTERLSGLGLRDRIVAGTFHSVASAQLRRYWADRGTSAPALLERKSRLLAPLAAARPALAGVDLADLASQVEWAKARLVGPDDFVESCSGRALPAPAPEIAQLYRRYEHEKLRRGLVDFDDLLSGCADALERDPTFAGAQRWWWRHVFVDEFQDLNPLQHRLLRAWLGGRDDLCAVGDPNQAIYGWNGADPDVLRRFAEHWPEATIVRLDDNHRCTPQVVAAAAAVLGVSGQHLRSTRADGPPPEVRSYPSEAAEAHGVAVGLRQARASGLGWSHMAVLVRTNAQSVALRGALKAAGIPHRVPGGSALLDEPVVKAALADLRRRANLPFQLLIADLETQASSPGAPGAGDPGSADLATISALAQLARQYLALDPEATVTGLCSWLPTIAGDAEDCADAVVISSFHRAKGLEWPAVWVCGLERGLVPLGRATTAAAEAEERRLLYVALTRAERELHCSWAETRTFGQRAIRREPSPWLDLLQPDSPKDTTLAPREADAAQWRERLAEQRLRLADDPVRSRRSSRHSPDVVLRRPDPATVEALRAWRGRRARAAGVPAHVLLHEATLNALASLRPSTQADLLDVPGLGPVKAARFGEELLAVVGSSAAAAAG